ncbi:uncharacterized protein LOC106636204 [Copidosoma floridanum]|uniref:uncharacterized protein LOC106636204 n=1 Tax=Copidosoma floridanum TaxID=29053 RepID=UPI0006C9972C|nr:uncharacterized protein LOC106636204 [Copidosoma floridanum]
MDDTRLLRQYAHPTDLWTTLVYNFLVADGYFRTLFNFGPYCGPMTTLTSFLIVLVFAYTVNNWSIFLRNSKKFWELSDQSKKTLPRTESVMEVEPNYTCVREHLQQMETYMKNTKKEIHKYQLEVKFINSRINSTSTLLSSPVMETFVLFVLLDF